MSRWLIACLAAVGVWGVWGLLFASASNLLSPLMVQVLTTVGLTPVAVGLLFSREIRHGTHKVRGAAWGLATGLGGTLGNIALSQSFALGGEASIITPLTAMFPLVTVVLAVVFLRERLNAIQGAGILVALGAILLFSSMGSTEEASGLSQFNLASPWMMSALGALLLYGIQGVTQKLSMADISSELGTICYWIVSVVASAVIVLTQELDWTAPPHAWALVLGAGALMGVAILIGLVAYRDGKASVVTALIALYPVITVILAIPFLGETITLHKGVAIATAVVAGLALTYERTAPVLSEARSHA